MSLKIFKVVKSLRERLISFGQKSTEIPNEFKSGIIFGFTSVEDNSISYCLGAVDNDVDIPSGTTALGVYSLDLSVSDQQLIDSSLKCFKNKKSGKLLILSTISENESIDLMSKCLDIKSKQFCETGFEVIDDNEAINQTIVVSFKANICLTFEKDFEKDKQIFGETLNQCLDNLKEDINSFDIRLVQSSFETNISTNDKSFNSLTVTDLYGYLEEDPNLFDGIEVPANMKKKMIEKMRKKKATDKSPLEFVGAGENGPKSDYPSVIELSDQKISLNLLVDSLSLIQENNNVSYLLKLFSAQIKRKSEQMVKTMLESVDFETNKLVVPKIYNFWPKKICSHFISIVYPIGFSDEQLIDKRKEMHLKYLIPMERPVFRKSNRFLLETETLETGYLMSVHIGLKHSGVKGGQVFVVDGDYCYHHYMQDRVDDNGWGCAYRSLQTIVSWLRLQCYTDKPVPSHTDIQKALVEVGDKPESFAGSRQWIGSQEVSFVLNHLYGITSRIMFVNSGAELANKGRELAHHFSTNGSPIMIGGGVLAHTIIGIDFDENTGELKFLILDPHYTGAEDLATVQKKGWCGWKATTFWDKNSFYNLCLPQRPLVF